jgi:hypothetical protein
MILIDFDSIDYGLIECNQNTRKRREREREKGEEENIIKKFQKRDS